MKSIKPGRAPSGMSFIGSVFAIIFGVFWTFMAISITANAPFWGIKVFFPLFGLMFIVIGIVQAVYHLKNATGKNRFSTFDITDSSEESDPMGEWVKNREINKENISPVNENKKFSFCPFCGVSLEEGFAYCPKCGKGMN